MHPRTCRFVGTFKNGAFESGEWRFKGTLASSMLHQYSPSLLGAIIRAQAPRLRAVTLCPQTAASIPAPLHAANQPLGRFNLPKLKTTDWDKARDFYEGIRLTPGMRKRIVAVTLDGKMRSCTPESTVSVADS